MGESAGPAEAEGGDTSPRQSRSDFSESHPAALWVPDWHEEMRNTRPSNYLPGLLTRMKDSSFTGVVFSLGLHIRCSNLVDLGHS